MARWSLRRQKRQWTAEPIVPPYPGAPIGSRVRPDTPQAALQIPAVWACVRLVSDAVAMMRLERFRDTPSGVPKTLGLGTLLMQPAAGRTLPEWLSESMISVLLRGNTYGKIITFDANGVAEQIELQNPDRVQVKVNEGVLEYWFNNVKVPTSQVWHLRGYTFPGSVTGMSPISYASQALNVAAQAEDFGESFFADGAHPSAVLATDQVVDQDAAQTIKDRFRSAVNGREPVVLGLGVKYEAIQVSPEESQFLETQKFSITQIARLFGVPPEMIGAEAGNSMTYANIEQRSLDFLTYTIQPWLTRLENSLSAMLPANEYVRFDTSVLTRTDSETRTKVQVLQVAGKIRTQTEVRAADGLAPMTPAQLAEANLIPLIVSPSGTVKPLPAADKPVLPPAGEQKAFAGSVVVNVPAPEVRVETPITVLPSPPPNVKVEAPITIQPADVRVIHQPAPTSVRTVRTIERNAQGDMTRIVEEAQ